MPALEVGTVSKGRAGSTRKQDRGSLDVLSPSRALAGPRPSLAQPSENATRQQHDSSSGKPLVLNKLVPILVNELVSSQLFSVHRSTHAGWVRDGLPVLKRAGRGGAHQIDLSAAIRWVRARDAEACEERLAAARSPALEAARHRKLTAEAKIAELNADEREGQLVLADQVGERWARIVGSAKERLRTLAAVAVSKGLISPDHEDALAALVDDALAELAGGP